jgi:outer membrane lipoprotein-sorting protein
MKKTRDTEYQTSTQHQSSHRGGDARRRSNFELVFGVWCLVFGVLNFAPPSSAADSPALTTFFAAQTNLQTWSADLTQTRKLKTLMQPLQSTGHVWFAAPNRFRWEIGNPPQTIAVRAWDEMLVIYPRFKRVEKYPLAGERMGEWKDTLALLEAGFPRGQSDLDARFKILSVTQSNELHNAVLQPKSSSARRMMPEITISFSTNDFMLRATELQFADGSSMRNEFRNAETNPKLDEKIFAPQIEGYTVVEPLKR